MRFSYRNDWKANDGDFGLLCFGTWFENGELHLGLALFGFVFEVWSGASEPAQPQGKEPQV